jgi:hypothetical protein
LQTVLARLVTNMITLLQITRGLRLASEKFLAKRKKLYSPKRIIFYTFAREVAKKAKRQTIKRI